jgi:hypothetical protein
MFINLKIENPDTSQPSNHGKLWTTEEENTLLQELDKNINIEIIAENHNRTVSGIRGKQRNIAYNMYVKNVAIDEIMRATKLDKQQIMETVTKKQMSCKKVKTAPEPILQPKKIVLEKKITEISMLRSEIKELKNKVNEILEMMKAVYEFENST